MAERNDRSFMKISYVTSILLFFILLNHSWSNGQDLLQVKSWGYQLSEISAKEIHESSFDLFVIDYSRDGSEAGKFTKQEMDLMKKKPDGSSRILLAYLSIGEAEDYRFYWKKKFKKNKPSWLREENPQWPGNYKVYYWESAWQNIIYGQPSSYLDQIMDMGFDGVYLDIIDGFEYYQDSIPQAARYMSGLVSGLSGYAKTKSVKPFYIVGQNGETLIEDPDYLKAIDGVGKEDLYFGLEGDGLLNGPEEVAYSLKYLRKAIASEKKVLLVEYVAESNHQDTLFKSAMAEKFIPFFSGRELDRLMYDPYSTKKIKSGNGRITPGRFYSVIMPQGTLRGQLVSEYYTEKYLYYIPKNSEEDYEFTGRDYFEWNNSALLYYTFRHNWELGIQLPVVYAHVLPDLSDPFHNHLPHYNYKGLGMAQIILNHGKSWNHYNDNMLFELSIGVPTDRRKFPFNPGTYGRIGFTREHYGKRIGFIGVGALNYYTNSDFTGVGFTPEIQAGIGIKVTESFFCSALLIQDFLMPRAEVNAEYLLGRRYSIETCIGKGFINSRQTCYASLILNYIFR